MNKHMILACVAGLPAAFRAEAGEAPTEASAADVKRARVAEKDYDLDNQSVEFKFSDGTTLTLAMSEVPAETVLNLTLHGALQKIGDSYASSKGDVVKAKEAASQVIEQLKRGEWRVARGEGEGKPRVGQLAAAIARVKGISAEQAMEVVQAATDEQRKEWRAHPRVKAAIAQIAAEKANADLAAAEAAGTIKGF